MAAVLERQADATTVALGRRRGFDSGAREIDDAPMRVRGALPEWLHGSLLLNGPALWDLPGGHYEHWFDGLAMLHRVSLGDGPPRYRSRFLRSDDYLRSLERGAPTFAGFDTPDPSSLLDRLAHLFKPHVTDNASVVMSKVGGRWVAMTETPYLIGFDPRTLETSGHVPFVGKLSLHMMAAHGYTEPDGTYWNVGTTLGPTCTQQLLRIRPGGGTCDVVAHLRMPKAGYTHAFAMAPGHAVLWECALRAQPLSFLFSRRSFVRNMRWEPEHGSRLHAVSLADGSVRSWNMAPMLCFHAVQAYALGDDLFVELCQFDDERIVDDFRLDALRAGRPIALTKVVRHRLRPGHDSADSQTVASGFELPQIHPDRIGQGRARVAFGAGMDPLSPAPFFDRTQRLNLDTGECTTWQRADAVHLEPLFVARPGGRADDDGVLLVPTLADDDPGGVIGVVDAHTMECLATLQAPQVVPFGFHAAWAQA